MNTADLIERVAAEHGAAKDHTKKILDSAFAAIFAAASAGEEVTLAGFGRFKVTDRAERQGRNPATGETIAIAASKKLAFTAAKNIRDALNAGGAAASSMPPQMGDGAARNSRWRPRPHDRKSLGEMSDMPIGTVKWFNPTKGYGFILPEGGGPDVFVHISAVQQAGLQQLNDGQRISFDVEPDRRGKTSAINLKTV